MEYRLLVEFSALACVSTASPKTIRLGYSRNSLELSSFKLYANEMDY